MQDPLSLLVAMALNFAVAQSSTVQWTGERLTVQAVNAPLQALVEEVARRTGVEVTGSERLMGARTIDIAEAPLLDALKVLLEDVNFIITNDGGQAHIRIHSMARTAPALPVGPISIAGLTDQVVSPPGDVPDPAKPDHDETDEEEKEDQEHEAETKEAVDAQRMQEELEELESVIGRTGSYEALLVAEGLESSYPAVRVRAVQLLARQPSSPDVLEEIISAFDDDEVNVRLTASDVLARMPGELAILALEGQLRPDAHPNAQFAALRALALRAAVESLPAVRRAASEAHPKIRSFAAQLTRALEALAGQAAGKPKG